MKYIFFVRAKLDELPQVTSPESHLVWTDDRKFENKKEIWGCPTLSRLVA